MAAGARAVTTAGRSNGLSSKARSCPRRSLDCRGAIDAFAVEHPDQNVHPGDRHPIEPHDRVEAHQAGHRRRSLRLNRGDHCSGHIVDFGRARAGAELPPSVLTPPI